MMSRSLFLVVLFQTLLASIWVNAAKILTVGVHSYEPPYSQYPKEVEEVLTNALMEESPAGRRPPRGSNGVYTQADWLVQLALAHRSIIENEVTTKLDQYPQDVVAGQRSNFDLSLNAFKEAVRMYQGLLLEGEKEPEWVVKHHIASVYFQIGETYSLDPTQTKPANEYLEQADELFRFILETKHTPRVDPISRGNVEMSWASCSLRYGANLLGDLMDYSSQVDDMAELEELIQKEFLKQQQEGNAEIDLQTWLAENPHLARKLADDEDNRKRRIDRACSLFEKAIEIYEKAIANNWYFDNENGLQRHLATALQNRGTAAVMAANFEDAVFYLEKSTAVFEELLDKGQSWMVDEASAALADSYYSLADSYIQLGRHAESTDRYNQAMAILEKFQLPAAASPAPTTDAVNESIAAFEKALEEYQSLMNDPTNEEEYSIDDQGNPIYEKDDGYEGDLYTTLGSLYLSNGDYVTAESNLLQAIRLYDMSGEDTERSTADAKFNLAAIYYQNNRFRESAEIRSEALSIYLETVGEGINPLSDGTPALDLSEFQSRHKKETDSTIQTKGDLEAVISVEDYNEAMDNETARDEL